MKKFAESISAGKVRPLGLKPVSIGIYAAPKRRSSTLLPSSGIASSGALLPAFAA